MSALHINTSKIESILFEPLQISPVGPSLVISAQHITSRHGLSPHWGFEH